MHPAAHPPMFASAPVRTIDAVETAYHLHVTLDSSTTARLLATIRALAREAHREAHAARGEDAPSCPLALCACGHPTVTGCTPLCARLAAFDADARASRALQFTLRRPHPHPRPLPVPVRKLGPRELTQALRRYARRHTLFVATVRHDTALRIRAVLEWLTKNAEMQVSAAHTCPPRLPSAIPSPLQCGVTLDVVSGDRSTWIASGATLGDALLAAQLLQQEIFVYGFDPEKKEPHGLERMGVLDANLTLTLDA